MASMEMNDNDAESETKTPFCPSKAQTLAATDETESHLDAKPEPSISAPQPFEPIDLTVRWEIAAITFYADCFQKLWHLPQVFAEDIEDGCNALCEDLASQYFLDFLIALLQSFRKCVEINRDNYQSYLARIATEAGKGDVLERFANQSFWALSPEVRIDLLMALCIGRIDLDMNSPESKVKEIEADTIRIEPLGEDSKGQTYWHFGDTRLYRDVPPPPPPPPKKKAPPPKPKGKAKSKRKFGARSRKGKKKASPKKDDKSAQDSDLDSSHDVSLNEKQPEAPKSRWELVCSTEEQWQSFFADLSTSKKKEDIQLYHTMSERILPNLQEIFAEKERIMKKRAMMLLPRRQSTRLDEKRKAFVDAGRFISYIAHDGQVISEDNNDAAQLDESYDYIEGEDGSRRKFRRPPMTNEEALERKKQMEEEAERNRLKAASARANRANRRAEGLPACLEDGGSQDGSQHLNGEEHSEEEEEDEEDAEMTYYRMEEIILSLTKHQDAPPFVEPVTIDIAPDYYDVIKHPVCLRSMAEKLQRQEYRKPHDLIADFDQLCQNCILYNGEANPFSKRVQRLSRHFQTLLRQNFPQAAKERIDRGYVGQIHRNHQQKATPQFAKPHRNKYNPDEFDTSADMSGPDAGEFYGGPDDPDYSPTRDRSPDYKPAKKPRRSKNASLLSSPGSSSNNVQQKSDEQYYNHLDELLGADIDSQIANRAIQEMASIRAKASSPKKPRNVPIQPKSSDFMAGYQQQAKQFQRSQSRTPKQPKTQASIARPSPNPAQNQSQFTSPPHVQPVAVFRQTPAGLTVMPGAYFRPTIGELPPPIRRTPGASSTPQSNGLRSLLLNTTGSTSTPNAVSPANATPTIRIKLVAAAKPGAVQHQQQATPQKPTGPLAFMVPIQVAQSQSGTASTTNNATVLLVPSNQQIQVARVAQVAQAAQAQVNQQHHAIVHQNGSGSAHNGHAETNSVNVTNGSASNPAVEVSATSSATNQTTFTNAFMNFVNSSSSAKV